VGGLIRCPTRPRLAGDREGSPTRPSPVGGLSSDTKPWPSCWSSGIDSSVFVRCYQARCPAPVER